MDELKILVTGAGGRMGRALIRAVCESEGLVLSGALERPQAETLGADAGSLVGLPPLGIVLTDNRDEALEGAQAIIDFTAPGPTIALAHEVAKRGLVHVIGTTGCTAQDEASLHEAARAGARIVKSGNMSLGVNLLAALVKKSAAALGSGYDIEIVEMHHNQKVDAPSGTALMLGEAAANGRQIELEANAVKSREGITGVRQEGTIGFATLRGGTVVGEHKVIFAGPSERIELTHVAQDRSLFANGALQAVRWAATRPAGYYSMADVLGLDQTTKES